MDFKRWVMGTWSVTRWYDDGYIAMCSIFRPGNPYTSRALDKSICMATPPPRIASI